jgi:hypothetical protein
MLNVVIRHCIFCNLTTTDSMFMNCTIHLVRCLSLTYMNCKFLLLLIQYFTILTKCQLSFMIILWQMMSFMIITPEIKIIFMVMQSRLPNGQCMIRYKWPTVQNKLPDNQKEACSVCTFRKKFKIFRTTQTAWFITDQIE